MLRLPWQKKWGSKGAGAIFDKAGQMRDMIQNHLLQILCMIAMSPPSDLSADSIRDEKSESTEVSAPH